ncbi:hypothetical protein BU14_0251s0006, partial [Porphyra umbilicalis]
SGAHARTVTTAGGAPHNRSAYWPPPPPLSPLPPTPMKLVTPHPPAPYAQHGDTHADTMAATAAGATSGWAGAYLRPREVPPPSTTTTKTEAPGRPSFPAPPQTALPPPVADRPPPAPARPPPSLAASLSRRRRRSQRRSPHRTRRRDAAVAAPAGQERLRARQYAGNCHLAPLAATQPAVSGGQAGAQVGRQAGVAAAGATGHAAAEKNTAPAASCRTRHLHTRLGRRSFAANMHRALILPPPQASRSPTTTSACTAVECSTVNCTSATAQRARNEQRCNRPEPTKRTTAATGVAATRRRGVATARRGRTRCLVAGVPAAAGAAAAADVGCLVFAAVRNPRGRQVNVEPHNAVSCLRLVFAAHTSWEGGDPSARADAASGRESTDSLPPGGSPRGGEHVAPRSQGGGEPRPGSEPAGGSSSRAPRGSSGGLVSVGPALQDAIAEAVRSEIARSLPVTPGSARSSIERPDPQRSGQTQSRRRLHYSSQSSDGDYSGGDSPRGSSQRHPRRGTPRHAPLPRRHRSAQRSAGPITVNNPNYRDLFDCETYSLENRSVSYTREHAPMMGRLKKDVMHSFGHRSEWSGDPPQKVFQFLRKFSKACDDNDVSEGEAFYMLQEFTLEPLRAK